MFHGVVTALRSLSCLRMSWSPKFSDEFEADQPSYEDHEDQSPEVSTASRDRRDECANRRLITWEAQSQQPVEQQDASTRENRSRHEESASRQLVRRERRPQQSIEEHNADADTRCVRSVRFSPDTRTQNEDDERSQGQSGQRRRSLPGWISDGLRYVTGVNVLDERGNLARRRGGSSELEIRRRVRPREGDIQRHREQRDDEEGSRRRRRRRNINGHDRTQRSHRDVEALDRERRRDGDVQLREQADEVCHETGLGHLESLPRVTDRMQVMSRDDDILSIIQSIVRPEPTNYVLWFASGVKGGRYPWDLKGSGIELETAGGIRHKSFSS